MENNSPKVGYAKSPSSKEEVNHDACGNGFVTARAKLVGAPPEVVASLEESCAKCEALNASGRTGTGSLGEDPALDHFMEAYCEMLVKYEQELTKPFKEAMFFFSRIDCQSESSSQNEADVDENNLDTQAEDRELKLQLLRKYSGYLGSLKKEFLKKKKNGKLPKEARQQLLDWWNRHYKWPKITKGGIHIEMTGQNVIEYIGVESFYFDLFNFQLFDPMLIYVPRNIPFNVNID